jgi:hypothetical protein
MKIKVENAYSDGHESTIEYVIDDAVVDNAIDDEDMDFFDELLYTYTGDGHGIDKDLDCYCTVTVTESIWPELVGYIREWD